MLASDPLMRDRRKKESTEDFMLPGLGCQHEDGLKEDGEREASTDVIGHFPWVGISASTRGLI